ncbi:MAG: 4-hydroxythreonine-4-phosphate dehydrogenase PdxA [Paludibacter sp.]|jgi:4-hydroxythreonine-4-phosphate dehydrogenase|nr:4-hydroxythreonine-4-phosphate dehydrogenase PdxA [Paludibacter sp.]
MEKERIVVGITHGDINGISYEIILKTFADGAMLEQMIPVIYGSPKVAAYYRKVFDIQGINFNVINTINELNPRKVNIINVVSDEIKVEIGLQTAEAGAAAYLALERATDDLKQGYIDALVTAPINKKNIQSDKFNFPGHTEYLQNKFGSGNAGLMLLVNDVMRVAVATGHIPVEQVSKALTTDLIFRKIQQLNRSLVEDFSITRPRIAVLGLNPHAGDNGVIGSEEENIIIPALKLAADKGIVCVGPYSADGFFGSGQFKKFDGILAMYHDQGLIPFKTISMENGVNFTAGLPIIRTSPDHGTAYDLAGKNLASEESFRHALYAAVDVYHSRANYKAMTANPLKIEHRAEQGGRIE